MLSTDDVFGSSQAKNFEGWIQSELAHDRAGISGGNIKSFTELPLYSNKLSDTNEPADYMNTILSTQANVPLQEFVPPNEEGCLHLEAVKALDILSQHLAHLDKLTTCDVICLSHLQDRMRGLTMED